MTSLIDTLPRTTAAIFSYCGYSQKKHPRISNRVGIKPLLQRKNYLNVASHLLDDLNESAQILETTAGSRTSSNQQNSANAITSDGGMPFPLPPPPSPRIDTHQICINLVFLTQTHMSTAIQSTQKTCILNFVHQPEYGSAPTVVRK